MISASGLANWAGWQSYYDMIRRWIGYLLGTGRLGENLRRYLQPYVLGGTTADVRRFWPRTGHQPPSCLVATQTFQGHRGWPMVMEGPAGRILFFCVVPPLAGAHLVYGQERVPLPGQGSPSEYGASNCRRLGDLVLGLGRGMQQGLVWVDMIPPHEFVAGWEALAEKLGASWLGPITLDEALSAVLSGAVSQPPAGGEEPPGGESGTPPAGEPPAAGGTPPVGGGEAPPPPPAGGGGTPPAGGGEAPPSPPVGGGGTSAPIQPPLQPGTAPVAGERGISPWILGGAALAVLGLIALMRR